MIRDCLRCGFTLPLEDFPLGPWPGRLHVCTDCQKANAVIWRVAAVAGDGILRLAAIDALLTIGYVRAARVIAAGATYWPTMLQLREGIPMPSTAVVDLIRRRHDRAAADVAPHA